jgi:hypothetical protein
MRKTTRTNSKSGLLSELWIYRLLPISSISGYSIKEIRGITNAEFGYRDSVAALDFSLSRLISGGPVAFCKNAVKQFDSAVSVCIVGFIIKEIDYVFVF